jgi:hypothetical protein
MISPYAGDTVIIIKNLGKIKTIKKIVEKENDKNNLKFNKKKCCIFKIMYKSLI